MRTISATIATLFFTTLLSAGERGAKSIFVDTTSGVTVQSRATKPVSHTAKQAARKPPNERVSASVPAPEVSGLMYYLELVSAKGETSRVTTDRAFTSGERILLHVVSAIEGDIAIYQRTPNGQAARLFPDERIKNGNAWIAKGVDTALPSPTSWFRFDDQPGIEELTIVLSPRIGSNPPPQSPTQTVSMSYADIGGAAGSKGLVVEMEREGPAPATYVVRRAVNGQAPEPIVVTLRLKHK